MANGRHRAKKAANNGAKQGPSRFVTALKKAVTAPVQIAKRVAEKRRENRQPPPERYYQPVEEVEEFEEQAYQGESFEDEYNDE